MYGVLRWELRYLASAVILGPCTLLRPYVVAAAAVAVIAVLVVEPILDSRAK